MLDLATRALPPSVTGGLPTGVDGVGASTALLAAVLVARTPAVVDADITSVLAAYTSQGYLKLGTPKPAPGDAVVLVGGRGRAGPADRGRPAPAGGPTWWCADGAGDRRGGAGAGRSRTGGHGVHRGQRRHAVGAGWSPPGRWPT